jgi:hypothetical protein
MLGEEEGLSENLTNYSSGRRSDECARVVRSGGGSNLSSGESEFLRKRNSKEGGEWMEWQIMRLPVTFIGRRREGRRYRGGEMVHDECSSSMVLFWGEEGKRQHPFRKGKGAHEAALVSRTEERLEDAAVRWCVVARVGQRLN